MISTELSALSDYCIGWGAQGRSMPPRELASLARCLLDLSHQVAQLERQPVDDAALVAYAAHGDADDY